VRERLGSRTAHIRSLRVRVRLRRQMIVNQFCSGESDVRDNDGRPCVGVSRTVARSPLVACTYDIRPLAPSSSSRAAESLRPVYSLRSTYFFYI